MNNKVKEILIAVGLVAIGFGVGFLIGWLLIKPDAEPDVRRIVEIKYVKGDTITKTIPYPVPYIVTDSVRVPVPVATDTAALFAVWRDYYLKREYALDFSNDTVGVFKVNAAVSENKLIYATSIIQPNIRTVTEREVIYKHRKWVPWAMIGTSVDFRTNKVQLGLDINERYTIGASGIRLDDKYGYTIDFGIKFGK